MAQSACSSLCIGTATFLSHRDIRERIAGLENRLLVNMTQRPKLGSEGRGVNVGFWVCSRARMTDPLRARCQSTRVIDHAPAERRWPTGTAGQWVPIDANRRAGMSKEAACYPREIAQDCVA